MDSASIEHILKSIEPKSDQLNADDLLAGPKIVKVAAVKGVESDKQQPIVILLEDGLRPYKPCKTMRRILVSLYTADGAKWVGHKLRLFRDPEVMLSGVKVGGIRISHVTGIDSPRTFIMTVGRGRRVEITIHPLEEQQPYVDDVLAEIAAAESTEQLAAIGFILKTKSKQVQDAVRGAYAARKKALDTTKGETQCGQ